MVELKGSEKQIKWANDLRIKMNEEADVWISAIKETHFVQESTQQKALAQIQAVKNYINGIENSGDIIKEFKDFITSDFDRSSNMSALVRKVNGTCSIGRAESIFSSKVFGN